VSLRVVLYTPAHEPAVRVFHERLQSAGVLLFTMQETAPAPNPNQAAPGIEFRHFVVLDEKDEVRGGYFMRIQPCWIRGEVQAVGHYTAPLSEGVADRRYTAVGPLMLAHALEEQPSLFAMGMGGRDRPLPRMLQAMGWSILDTPFHFLVLRGKEFLRNAGALRASTARRLVTDALAFSGLGHLAIQATQAVRARRRTAPLYDQQPIACFSGWADRIWLANAAAYSFSAVRNADYLRFIYPTHDPSFYGAQLLDQGMPVAWVEMLDCRFRDRSYFGEMHVAALVDGVGPAAAIPSLVRAAVEAARRRHADIVISNQMHRDWTSALVSAGFWQGPSNYLLALSKPLAKQLEPLDETVPRIHFNRGDGDGRVNLLYTES